MNKILRFFLVFGFLFVAAPASAERIEVPAGGDLQSALTRAQPGDVIVLQAGSRYVGQFKFPAKTSAVTLTTSATLPNRRLTPADSALLPTIASGVAAMSLDLANSRNWIIDGVAFEGNVGGFGEVISIQAGENIVLRRLVFDLPNAAQQKRFILGNGRNITLTQSYCAGVWRSGQDSQCFAAWDGAGPYTITNNYLEAASENVMFGGADSTSPENVPSDILIEGNLFTKRLSWKDDGVSQVIKNLFELKAARRVTIRNNIFENNWGGEGQGGAGIVFTPRNQSGTAPWTVIEDVLFENNTVRNTPIIFNILGYDNIAPSGQTTRIVIKGNYLTSTQHGRLATLGNEIGTLTLDNNTYASPQPSTSSMITLYAEGNIATGSGPRPATFAAQNLITTGSRLQCNAYGVHSSAGFGTAALLAMTKEYTWTNNILGGTCPGSYPAGTMVVTLEEFAKLATPPPPTTEPVPVPDPTEDPEIAALKAELAAAKLELAAAQSLLNALQIRFEAVVQYLANTPETGKVQNLIRYLRLVPR